MSTASGVPVSGVQVPEIPAMHLVATGDEPVEPTGSHLAGNYHPLPVQIASAEGAWVRDVAGIEYLDLLAGYSALNFGHRHPALVAAAHAQLDRLTLTSRAFEHDRLGLFADRLAALVGPLLTPSPDGRRTLVLPMNTGVEAVETAIKAARKWGYDVRGVAPDAATIVVASGNFHGRTTTVISFSDDDDARRGFGPYTPGFRVVPYADAAALAAAIDDTTVAVLLEPVQGEGGIVMPPPGYLAAVRAACDRAGALLILDEIQTGLGRTGRWWASEHFGVVPDIMTIAKSLGGSLVPISATVFTEDLREFMIPNPFIHLSTFGGSDIACAVALEVIAVMEETELVAHAAAMGERLFTGLRSIAEARPEVVAEVRGLGLMAGIEYSEDSMGPRMSYHLARHGVLAIYSGNQPAVMRLMPSLVIEEAEVDFLLEALDRAISDLVSGAGPEEPTPTRPRRRPVRPVAAAG